MGFPDKPRLGRTTESVAKLLNSRHGNNYMVWNLSEKQYDCSPFLGQVVDISFPGHPAPPLPVLFNLCTAMESWLNGDPANVVIIHCLTGRGRSIVVAACVLKWIGKAARSKDALVFACSKRNVTVPRALVPTQLRYAALFDRVMDGERPSTDVLCVKTITMHCVPNLLSPEDAAMEGTPAEGGCRPYMQVFKNGQCLFTTALADQDSEEGTRFFRAGADQSLSLPIDCLVAGDCLIRVRHLDSTTGKGSSVFRYGFHAGFEKPGTISLRLRDLDGPSLDKRFVVDTTVEIEFAPAGESNAAVAVDPTAKNILDGSSEDVMATFWDEIDRKREQARQRTEAQKKALVDSNESLAKHAAGATSAAGEGPENTPFEFSILDDEDEEEEEAHSPMRHKNSDHDLYDELNALSLDQQELLATPAAEPPAVPTVDAAAKKSQVEDAPENAQAEAPPRDSPASSAGSAKEAAALAKEGEPTGSLLDLSDDEAAPATAQNEGVDAAASSDADSDAELFALARDLTADGDVDKDATAPTPDSEDPDLEELEKYLQDM